MAGELLPKPTDAHDEVSRALSAARVSLTFSSHSKTPDRTDLEVRLAGIPMSTKELGLPGAAKDDAFFRTVVTRLAAEAGLELRPIQEETAPEDVDG